MKVLQIKIAGMTPLLMRAFTDEDQMKASSGSTTSAAGREYGTPYEQAKKHLYVSEQDGAVIIPQPNLFACIIAAGKFFKAGKSKVTTMKTSLIPACVAFSDTEFPLEHDGWQVDTRAVRIPATGGRIQRHRPLFDKWAVGFTCTLDTDEMSEKLFREIVDAAGSKIGLGDFRPETKGPFGRFAVVSWEELGDEADLTPTLPEASKPPLAAE